MAEYAQSDQCIAPVTYAYTREVGCKPLFSKTSVASQCYDFSAYGYVYAQTYADTTCQGPETEAVGFAINKCISRGAVNPTNLTFLSYKIINLSGMVDN